MTPTRGQVCLLVALATACARATTAGESAADAASRAEATGRRDADAAPRDHGSPLDAGPGDGGATMGCQAPPESRCCERFDPAASGTLIEQADAQWLHPLRALAFEPRRCGLFVAGYDERPTGGHIAVSHLSVLTDPPAWVETFETAGSGSAYHMALAPNGDVVVAGGTAWLGDRQPERAWLHRLSPEGDAVWDAPRTFGPGDYTDSRGVAVRDDGVIAMIGSFNGDRPQSTYVALFDPSGSELWPEPYQSSELIEGGSVVFARDGGLVLGGRRSLTDDGGLAIVRIDPQGAALPLASDAFTGPAPVFSPSMALDADGNLVVAACHAPGEWRELWLQKFDLSGQALWAEPVSLEWEGHIIVQDLALSPAGEIAIVGTTQIPIPGWRDIWVMLYGADGTPLWDEPFVFDGLDSPFDPDDASDDLGWAVDFDQWGNVLVAGWYLRNRAFLGRIAH